MVIANCVQCTSTTADALSKQEGQADRGSLLCLAEKEGQKTYKVDKLIQ